MYPKLLFGLISNPDLVLLSLVTSLQARGQAGTAEPGLLGGSVGDVHRCPPHQELPGDARLQGPGRQFDLFQQRPHPEPHGALLVRGQLKLMEACLWQ